MSATPKHPLPIVLPVANRIVDALRPHCARIELAGSIRRERPTVGDIEIVAVPIRPVNLFGDPAAGPTSLDVFLDSKVVFTRGGERFRQFAYGNYTVDLFLTDADTWGSIYTIRTGSWEFSRWLVTSQSARGAAPPNIQFRDGRLYESGRLLSTPEEPDIFAALGLAYIHPMERYGPIAAPPRIEPVWNYA